MHTWQVSALPAAPQQSEIDPYRFPGARDFDAHSTLTPADSSDDDLLSAPDPQQRIPFALPAADQRRLAVHVALTAKGVAPMPGDLDAIKALCTVDDTTLTAVLRWITGPH